MLSWIKTTAFHDIKLKSIDLVESAVTLLDFKHSTPFSSKSPDTQTPAAFYSIITSPDSLVWPVSLVPTNLDHQSSSD